MILVSTVQHNKTAYQSSTDWQGQPERAVDGNLKSDYFKDESCSHTKQEDDPWWMVDLEKSYMLSAIVLTIRTDCCSKDDSVENYALTQYQALKGWGAILVVFVPIPKIG